MALGGPSTPYTNGINKVANDFVDDVLISHLLPVVAAALVFKALLDYSQGTSPLASIVAAMFLLGIEGIYKLAIESWLTSGAYSTTDLLMGAFNYAAGTISPIVGGLALSAGILPFVQHKEWKRYCVGSGNWISLRDRPLGAGQDTHWSEDCHEYYSFAFADRQKPSAEFH